MSKKERIHYFCAFLVCFSKYTGKSLSEIIDRITNKDIRRHLKFAEVNCCLSFEQICEECSEDYGIEADHAFDGTFSIKREWLQEGKKISEKVSHERMNGLTVCESIRKVLKENDFSS